MKIITSLVYVDLDPLVYTPVCLKKCQFLSFFNPQQQHLAVRSKGSKWRRGHLGVRKNTVGARRLEK